MNFKKYSIALVMAGLLTPLSADQVILDDLIVVGSECIGQDCVNGESFGFDTLRLKENNLRIKFQDTSNSASFPTNDWQITANDSSNGGMNKFSIDDIDGGRTPFTLEAGAPSNSLYVDNGGKLGLGTSNPVVDIHTLSGNTPTLRLDQDGSSGFTPQVWDMAGNEANFFIRDVTNGSQLPFRIQPGADSDSLFIESTNDIGIGTDAPDAPLHVKRTNGTAKIHVEEASLTDAGRELLNLTNNGGSWVTMTDSSTSKSWYITHQHSDGNLNITHDDSTGPAMMLEKNGNMTITGTLTTGGVTCGGGCDLVFDKSYDLESIEEHAASMWENKHLPTVGPTIENEPFNLSEKTGRMLNELEKAHIYIDHLNSRLKEKENELVLMKSKIELMDNKYEMLAERLSSLEVK